jgi:hypothetical protein
MESGTKLKTGVLYYTKDGMGNVVVSQFRVWWFSMCCVKTLQIPPKSWHAERLKCAYTWLRIRTCSTLYFHLLGLLSSISTTLNAD